jgi:hypothetical protein
MGEASIASTRFRVSARARAIGLPCSVHVSVSTFRDLEKSKPPSGVGQKTLPALRACSA